MSKDVDAPLSEHLLEFRKRMVRVLFVFVAGLTVGLVFAKPLYLYFMGTLPDDSMILNVFSPWDGIKIYMNFAFLVSMLPTIPFAMSQLWAFLKPGLKVSEQKASLAYIPIALILFIAGLFFAYFVVFRNVLAFATSLSSSLELTETLGVTQYFSFMFSLVIPVSLLFELPVVVMFLTTLQILNPDRLRKGRRYAYLLLTIISTLITPPDLVSALLVSIPMILLFEASVLLSKFIYNRQQLKDKLATESEGNYAKA